ncbi:MAG: pyridoxal-phosphate dependent enzyme [Verrucomicrobiota bacterium]|nr:pyridoxal-phosphate dependent enzyme [Verrucomicrobiota bacterium]
MISTSLDMDLIAQASRMLQGRILRTPMEYSPDLSALFGDELFLKLEALQITGSFKVRGAIFYLSTLSETEKSRGVAACSAGNHGLGVAYAAKQLGISSTVYVPKFADPCKCDKIMQLGANVIRSPFSGYDDTLDWTRDEVKKNGLHLISAFEDSRIMAGNGGSLAAEILEDIPEVKNVIFPVGGGGLGAGIAYYLKEKNPEIRLIGCQHLESPALKLSFERGAAVTHLPAVETIAGGVEGGIGKECFEILKDRIDEVALVTENEIEAAFVWMMKHHQYLIEPTAVVTVAACLQKRLSLSPGKTALVITGRNVALTSVKKLLE